MKLASSCIAGAGMAFMVCLGAGCSRYPSQALAAPPPVVSGVSPNAGSVGATVQVLGTGFQPGSKVFFGSVQATLSGTPTSTILTVVVPNVSSGKSYDVKVVNPDGSQSLLGNAFFVF